MISTVILTKNEEEKITKCLNSLRRLADEIIVVDDNSEDRTRFIAKKYGAKVYRRDMNMDFSRQSNFGLQKSKGPWVLFIDADEVISDALAKEIKEKIQSNETQGFYLKRINFIWGKWLRYGEVGAFRALRLVRKGSGKWQRRVHPFFVIKGAVSELKNPLLHYPHQTLEKFIKNINLWSTWHALANKEEGKKASILKIIIFPPFHFFRNFFFRSGFLDGIEGFVFSALMSFHSFLAWSKLWLLQKRYSKI